MSPQPECTGFNVATGLTARIDIAKKQIFRKYVRLYGIRV
jgi:hypothetical protein